MELAHFEDKDFLDLILNSIHDGVVVVDLHENFLVFNPAAETLLGLGATQTNSAQWADQYGLYTVDDGQKIPQNELPLKKALQGLEVRQEEILIRNAKIPNGVIVSVNAVPLKDKEGKIVGAIATLRDKTENKKLQTQLQQAQKMESIGRLAGGIAHDFNNLLTAISGYTSILLDEIAPNDPLFENAEEINKAAKRAAGLTAQLLAFSRRQVFDIRMLNINEIIRDVEKMLKRLIGEDIQFKSKLEANLMSAKADQAQIEQVLVNLAVNARDAMPKGGSLLIETKNVLLDQTYAQSHPEVIPGPHVMLAVTDTGTGMSKEIMAQIFEPFFTTKEKGKGTGLGLSTVFGIVKQLHGQISVYSEVGHGTTFKIYLPAFEEKAASLDHEKQKAPASLTGSETVLLVEDDDGVRTLAHRVLKSNGYNVLVAKNGGEALLLCEKYGNEIHVMLTDVVMPQLNGRDLYRRIQKIKPDLKVIFMSGYTEDAVEENGFRESGGDFLQKPFSPKALLIAIRHTLDSIKRP